MRTLPEWDLGNLGRLYDLIFITSIFWPPYSQRILWIWLLKKRALVGLNVFAPQKKSFLRQGGEVLESLRRVLVQARTEENRPGENRCNIDAMRSN